MTPKAGSYRVARRRIIDARLPGHDRYWSDVEKIHEAIDAAGWMHTGDLAMIDAEGYCKIVGRIKDMVIRGGENVYRARSRNSFTGIRRYRRPRSALRRGALRRDACATARVPRPKRSAHSVRARSPITGCRVMSKFVDGFPTTVTGEIRKFLMRQQMIEELGLMVEETA